MSFIVTLDVKDDAEESIFLLLSNNHEVSNFFLYRSLQPFLILTGQTI
jgi:hypothetical protein